MEFSYFEGVAPLTQEDWSKYLEAFKRHGLPHAQLLYGSWLAESDEERKLRELAETYHTGNDAYDRRVCSGTSPLTGEAIPLTPDETRLVNRHALTMRDEMIAEGQRIGFTEEQVVQTIRNYVPKTRLNIRMSL